MITAVQYTTNKFINLLCWQCNMMCVGHVETEHAVRLPLVGSKLVSLDMSLSAGCNCLSCAGNMHVCHMTCMCRTPGVTLSLLDGDWASVTAGC